jgi:ferric-dicitrate binding protein FerR (iron transport regulator)
VKTENPTDGYLHGDQPAGAWSETTGERLEWRARVEAAIVRMAETPRNGRHLGAKEWIAIVAIMLTVVGMAGGVSAQLFRSRADGEVADTKFEDHTRVQMQFESDMRIGIREIQTEVKDVNKKLERMETKNRR